MTDYLVRFAVIDDDRHEIRSFITVPDVLPPESLLELWSFQLISTIKSDDLDVDRIKDVRITEL